MLSSAPPSRVPHSRQLIDSVVSSLDAQGTHASLTIALTPALLSHGSIGTLLPSLAVGALLRFLHQLPQPLLTRELYPQFTTATAASLPPLLRKLPTAHASQRKPG